MLTKRLIKPPAESTYLGLSVFKLYSETDDIIQGENNEKRTRGLEKSKAHHTSRKGCSKDDNTETQRNPDNVVIMELKGENSLKEKIINTVKHHRKTE